MTIAERIEQLRNSLPGCSLVAFGDAEAQLVLRSSQARTVHREHLDQLCQEAADCFFLMETAAAALETPLKDSAAARDAIVMTNSGAKIFVKSDKNDADFLCLVCGLPFEPGAIVASARTALNSIAETQ